MCFRNVFTCQAASNGMQGSGMIGNVLVIKIEFTKKRNNLDFAIYIYLKQNEIYTVREACLS